MRICSFLPSATEMLYALGVGEMVMAVSHECDYPLEAQRKPIVSRARFDHTQHDSAAIDTMVSQALQNGESLYTIDREVLGQANPDLIVTQQLCDVCAVTGHDLSQALKDLGLTPNIVTLTPTSLGGIFENIRTLGETLGLRERAERLIAELTARVTRVTETAQRAAARPTVFCLEWLDPPYSSGHWVPELVELAGGVDTLGHKGHDSTRVPWESVVAYAPEVLVVIPCGFDVARTMQEMPRLEALPGWDTLPAVQRDRVYVSHGSAYFSRPGPRVVDGLEILAHIIHPDLFPARYPQSVLRHVPQRRRKAAWAHSSADRASADTASAGRALADKASTEKALTGRALTE